MLNNRLDLDDIDVFIFDFDGVLTNNCVYLDQLGKELVMCSRADGLAFDVLRKLEKPTYIISTEKNPVVTARAKKIRIPVIQGVNNKLDILLKLTRDHGFALEKVLYVGNDLNDFHVMKSCGYTVCPADSHPTIQGLSNIVLKSNGGSGVARELLEDVIGLDFIKILYSE